MGDNYFIRKFYTQGLRELLLHDHFEIVRIENDGRRLSFIKSLKKDNDEIKTYDIVGLSVEILSSGRVVFNLVYNKPDVEYIVNQIVNNQPIEKNKATHLDYYTLYSGTIGDKRTMRCIIWSCFYDITHLKYKTFPDWLKDNFDTIPDNIKAELSAMANLSQEDYVNYLYEISYNYKVNYPSSKDNYNEATYSIANKENKEGQIIQFPGLNENDT